MRMHIPVVMLVSAIVNFLLLMGTNRMCGCRTKLLRCLLAAVAGGLHSGLCLIRPLAFLANPIWRTVSLAAMALLGFGMRKATWRLGAVFSILSLALNGIAQLLGGTGVGIAAAAAIGLCVLCAIGFRGRVPGQVLVPVEIHSDKANLQLTALQDTGNTLSDPVTGQPILVIDAESASSLTGLTKEQLKNPIDTMGVIPGLRLVPYRTVDQAGGLLLARQFPNVRIGKWKGSQLVAFAPEGLGGGYEALTGGAV